MQTRFLIKCAQQDIEDTESFKRDRKKLNLSKNDAGICECSGRIQRDFPVYMFSKNIVSEKLVEQAHLQTLHGGVALTMTKVREQF